jgi:hypothetical protein
MMRVHLAFAVTFIRSSGRASKQEDDETWRLELRSSRVH